LAQATTQPVDPQDQPYQLFGVTLVGMTPRNGHKLLMTLALIVIVVGLSFLLRGVGKLVLKNRRSQKVIFWTRQAINVLLAIILLFGVTSIWFSEPQRMATFLGLVSAGVAFALQKPITSLAGYIVILRGKTFNVGDRIVMGGVRGDVIELGFIQTTIMEMGEPPPVQDAPPAVWVEARQYTGRVVTVSNSVVFDEPVFNFTREFPFLWEEMRIPIGYKDDRRRAEQILLDIAQKHTVKFQEIGEKDLEELHRRYFTKKADVRPRVYFRLTDNWIEMTLRFIARSEGVRDLKDAMSREIIDALDAAKIGIASSTYDIVGLPPVKVKLESAPSPTRLHELPSNTQHG
jgi:small-conductance mechanosensitive channel